MTWQPLYLYNYQTSSTPYLFLSISAQVYTVDSFQKSLTVVGYAVLNIFVQLGTNSQPSEDQPGIDVSSSTFLTIQWHSQCFNFPVLWWKFMENLSNYSMENHVHTALANSLDFGLLLEMSLNLSETLKSPWLSTNLLEL